MALPLEKISGLVGTMTEEQDRIMQSNDIAGIVIDVMKKETPHMFPLLNLRYGIADALWGARYRKAEQ